MTILIVFQVWTNNQAYLALVKQHWTTEPNLNFVCFPAEKYYITL